MVAGLIDPSVGFTLTLAIAIHNLPEGLCIALPVYYSSGSRLKGFLLATLSGLSEPVGALIAWGIVASSGEDMNGTIYGILFGMVGGILGQYLRFVAERTESNGHVTPILAQVS